MKGRPKHKAKKMYLFLFVACGKWETTPLRRKKNSRPAEKKKYKPEPFMGALERWVRSAKEQKSWRTRTFLSAGGPARTFHLRRRESSTTWYQTLYILATCLASIRGQGRHGKWLAFKWPASVS